MQRKKEHDVKQKNPEPDRELVLWEKWIQIRNDETTKLGHKLQTPPVDLTMNLCEMVRKKKEWKTVLEHAKIERKPKVKGRLWEQPQRLKQSCYCTPVYELKRTPAEMGRPPVIEHVYVPQFIQQVEKGLTGVPERVECVQLNADFLKYKSKREQELAEKIAKIDPFRPEDNNLLIVGGKPKIPPKMPFVPNIVVTTELSPNADEDTVYAVRINNTVIVKNIPGQDLNNLIKMKSEPWHETCTLWPYYLNTSVKKAGRCRLFIQNLGTATLRYCWKKIKRPIPFIPEDIYEQAFFFNKNEDVLSPGQDKEIFFTFLSSKPGAFYELWELCFFNICFFDSVSEKLCVQLTGDSVENAEGIRKKFEILNVKIDRKATSNIMYNLLNECITKATTTPPQQYPYKNLFLDAEIFVMKNPVCFYHQTEVMKMHNLYSEMTNGQKWDLSINSWRKIMIALEFDDRMKYFDLLKISHRDLLRPWYEDDELLKKKYRVLNLLLSQMADTFDKKYEALVAIYNTPFENQEDKKADSSLTKRKSTKMDATTIQTIRNLFYIHAYESVSTTIETCAGVLSSMDLNRWIEFDFCQ